MHPSPLFSITSSLTLLFLQLFYEFIYTGICQAMAAYAPNAVFAGREREELPLVPFVTAPYIIGSLRSERST